jgi:ABC-type glycerol-3-phosphate transport system permease component
MAEYVATTRPKSKTRRFNGFRIFTYTVLTLAAVIYIFPFVWMLSKSVQNDFESRNTTIIPTEIVLQNYVDVLQGSNTLGISRQFSTYLWNTVKLEVLSVTLQTIVCVLAAYAFARINFPGRDLLFGLFLMTIFVPSIILLVPSLIIVTNISRSFEAIDPALKWMNNWPALVIPFLANTFSIFLLRQFFKQIPDELWDAARIDGAGHLRFLWQVVVPNSRAAVMTTVLFAFIGVWSALEWPILVTTDDTWRPIAVALLQFRQDGGEMTNYLMAASVIALIPIMVIYFFTQKQFTQGIVTTGLKG